MKTKFFLVAIILFGMGISNANAQIRKHAHNQKHRIKHGVKNDELTKKETKNLIEGQKKFARM